MFAQGLLDLSLATGEADYAVAARALLDATLQPPIPEQPPLPEQTPIPEQTPVPEQSPLPEPVEGPFTVPGGADPVLVAHGTALATDPSEGAYPSGLTATASAAHTLYLLTAERRYLDAARSAMALVAGPAVARPIGFGASLRLMARLASDPVQLVVVVPPPEPTPLPELVEGRASTGSASEASVLDAARTHPATLVTSVTEPQASALAQAGFELFEGRTAPTGEPTAYLCREFVCRLPTTDAAALEADGNSDLPR